jgi:hypothetical protein
LEIPTIAPCCACAETGRLIATSVAINEMRTDWFGIVTSLPGSGLKSAVSVSVIIQSVAVTPTVGVVIKWICTLRYQRSKTLQFWTKQKIYFVPFFCGAGTQPGYGIGVWLW